MNLQTHDFQSASNLTKGQQLEMELMVRLIGMPSQIGWVKAFGGGQTLIFYKGEIAFSSSSLGLDHTGILSVVDLDGRPYYEPLMSITPTRNGGVVLEVEMDLHEEGFAVAIPLNQRVH